MLALTSGSAGPPHLFCTQEAPAAAAWARAQAPQGGEAAGVWEGRRGERGLPGPLQQTLVRRLCPGASWLVSRAPDKVPLTWVSEEPHLWPNACSPPVRPTRASRPVWPVRAEAGEGREGRERCSKAEILTTMIYSN